MNECSDTGTPGKKARIMIVEDHPIFRLGMKELINQEDDLCVCGEADNITKGRNEIAALQPDMVIVDISLKGRKARELIHDISRDYKELPVLVLSMHDESLYAERAFHAGARGYIMKASASESIVKAIRCVLSGKIYASETFMESILSKFTRGQPDKTKSCVDILTNREMEVLQLIGEGFTSKQVAAKLSLSVKTISTYRERIKEKLDLKNAAELMRYAVSWVRNGQV